MKDKRDYTRWLAVVVDLSLGQIKKKSYLAATANDFGGCIVIGICVLHISRHRLN